MIQETRMTNVRTITTIDGLSYFTRHINRTQSQLLVISRIDTLYSQKLRYPVAKLKSERYLNICVCMCNICFKRSLKIITRIDLRWQAF